TNAYLCSNDSSVLYRGVTPQQRARGPCGLSLRPPSCDEFRRRCLRGLPVLVHEISRRVWGLRLRRTEQGLALSPLFMLPSAHLYRVGVRVVSFRSSIAHPAYTPVYASLSPSRYQRKTRGRVDRWSFLVRILHSLLHAGLSRRTNIAITLQNPSIGEFPLTCRCI